MAADRVISSTVGTLFSTLARARGARAVHPRGEVRTALLTRSGVSPSTGVPWIDTEGQERVLVRMSRSVGLPPPFPDVFGLSVRVDPGGPAPHDLLLSTAGRSPLTRHLLRPAFGPDRATYSSIVPFRTPFGRLMLGALPEEGGFGLAVAMPGSRWQRFAGLRLDPAPPGHPDTAQLDLDAVLHPFPGLDMPSWLARLREPAYRASRQARAARLAAQAQQSGQGQSAQGQEGGRSGRDPR